MTSGPRAFCDPPTAFGDLQAERRHWLVPDGSDPVVVSKFRAAVVQNVICLSVRAHKNAMGVPQQFLAEHDDRPDGVSKWNARLNGRLPLTMQDYATLLRIMPESLPDPMGFQTFLDVAEKRTPRPTFWNYPDT